MKIAIGSDHRGFNLKKRIDQILLELRHDVVDVGCSENENVDYTDFAVAVGEKVANGDADRGILICGTGIGMAIAANKISGVRAATCHDEVTAEICRRHNDVNVLCLSGDQFSDEFTDDMIEIWLETRFDGGRHARRIAKIQAIEDQDRVPSE